MSQDSAYYLEYELSEGGRVMVAFDDINQRDGCHISLDMYKVHLGAVDVAVVERIAAKFKGEIVTGSENGNSI